MLVLVLADNLVLMFVGWEGVGLCSYLLIGFWYADRWNAYCGSKAFIVNRIGDFGFLLGIFLLFSALSDAGTPTVAFGEIADSFSAISARQIALPGWLHWLPFGSEVALVNLIALCFFVGACGKSAQLPLYVWLPDAMAGPTPVSALIHAATMVTAGCYLVCRMSFLYAAAPHASALVAWTGALTAIFAATIAITQTDIKKVLAYSTVSQLGYMFLAAGCGGYAAAIFHLGTHAFFKALLFLGAGAVILAMHHRAGHNQNGRPAPQALETHLGLPRRVLAIAASRAPRLLSKDEILVTAFASQVRPPLSPPIGWGPRASILLHVTASTSTFWGESPPPREVREHLHDAGPVVINPLWVLAFFSVFGGLGGAAAGVGDLIGGRLEQPGQFPRTDCGAGRAPRDRARHRVRAGGARGGRRGGGAGWVAALRACSRGFPTAGAALSGCIGCSSTSNWIESSTTSRSCARCCASPTALFRGIAPG